MMRLEDVDGFVAAYPDEAATQALGLPCGEWAFLFGNGLGALVARNQGTPGARDGQYILSGFFQAKQQGLSCLPANPLVRLTQDEVIDWLFHIRGLGQNGMPHPSQRFPIAHFLYRFREIDESGWCQQGEQEEHGRRTVFGWLGVKDDLYDMTDEAEALAEIFGHEPLRVVGIAEGLDPHFAHIEDTKGRVMAALRDRIKARNRTRYKANQSPAFHRLKAQMQKGR